MRSVPRDAAARSPRGFSFAIGTPLDELSARERREQLAALADGGYALAEWTTRDAARVPAAELRGELDAAGLGLGALGTGAAALRDGLSLSAADPEVRARARARARSAVELAGALGGLAVVGLLRGGAAGDRDARARLAEALHALGEDALRAGTRIAVEPINRYEVATLPTLGAVAELLAEVGHPGLAPMADLFHMNIEEADPRAALVAHAPSLAYVHVADSNRLPPGEGHLPLRELLGALAGAGYDGPLVCEVLPSPTQIDSARRCADGLAAVA